MATNLVSKLDGGEMTVKMEGRTDDSKHRYADSPWWDPESGSVGKVECDSRNESIAELE